MSSQTHEEWKQENSLTAPSDRDRETLWRPEQNARELNNSEVTNAMKELNNTSFTHKFLKVERRYADPVEPSQRVGLISFVPAKGSRPNDKGIYGFAKLRGNYATEGEASERAEYLIRNVDSYHQIYHAYVGRPFPLTTSSKFSEKTDEIDLKKSVKESVSADVRKKRDEEQKIMDDMKEREEALIEDTREDKVEDPHETYTTLRVKKAQISWTYLETQKKLEEMKNIIIKTRSEIDDMDKENSEYKEQYYERYMKARRDAGIPSDRIEDNFVKYMVEDANLGF